MNLCTKGKFLDAPQGVRERNAHKKDPDVSEDRRHLDLFHMIVRTQVWSMFGVVLWFEILQH